MTAQHTTPPASESPPAQASVERSQFDFGLDPHFYDRVLDGMPTPLIVIDAEGFIRYANFAASDLTGWPIEDALGRHMLEFIHPDDQEWIATTYATLLGLDEGGTILMNEIWTSIQFRAVGPDGSTVPLDVVGKVALNDPTVQGVALALRETRMEAATKRVLQGIAVGADVDLQVTELTRAMTYRPLSLNAAAFRSSGRSDVALIHATNSLIGSMPLDDNRLAAALSLTGATTRMRAEDVPVVGAQLVAAGQTEFLHVAATSPDNDVTLQLVATSPDYLEPALGSTMRMEWAHELMTVILMREHTDRLLARAATVDPLTGLSNRRGLTDYLEQLDPEQPCSVLFIDLDGFKSINDRFGHAIGDEALVEIAHRLQRTVRLHDHVCRLGGDEFAIVIDEVRGGTLQHASELVAERIVESLRMPFRLGCDDVAFSASVGIALPHMPLNIEQLFERADTAMYLAKRAGGGQYAIGNETDDASPK